ncbi:MAG: TlpA family protein disulfide reductase [Planctomycetes bacterium]|nr:TlpA family protein disulfide reductase [Planctomycetota bacterium]
MYEKYRSRGFTVLAVNSYDEPRDKVERFAREHDLTHPILLRGREVSSLYHTRSHPFHVWIAKDGTVLETSVGFLAGDESKLERTLQRHLEKR